MLEFIASDNGKIETKAGNVVLNKKSPLFGTESIEGEITLPFTIPVTDELRRWLQYPDRPEAVNKKATTKRIQLKRNGTPVLMGDLKLGDADAKQIETTLITGSSPFAALIKDVCLDELDLGFQTFANEAAMLAYWNASLNGNVFTHPYYLPTIKSEVMAYQNYWFQDRGGYVLDFNGDPTYMSPMLYYAWLLPKLFESFGYEFEDRVFINHTELREQIFVSLHNVNSQEDKLTIHYADLLPHYKISTWLIDIQNAYFCRFFFDASKQKVVLDWQVSALNNASKAKKVPHGIVKMKAIDSTPCHFTYSLNDYESITQPTENINPAIWEKKDLPSAASIPNKRVYVVAEDKTYTSYYSPAEGKYIFLVNNGFIDVSPVSISIGKQEGTSLDINSNIYPFTALWQWNEPPNNRVYEEKDAKTIPPLILFAWHTTNAGTNWANSSNYLNNFSLNFSKGTWLLQNKILPWFEFLRKSRLVEDTISLSDTDLANWDWTVPVMINNSPVLVAEMEIPLSAESELMEVKILGWVM